MKLSFIFAIFISLIGYIFSKRKDIIRLRPKCQRFLTVSSCNLQDYCNWNYLMNECNHIYNPTQKRAIVYRRRPLVLGRRYYRIRRPVLMARRFIHKKK